MTDNEIVKAIKRLKNTKDFLREKYQEHVKNMLYPELKPIAKQTYEDNKKDFNIAIKALEEFNRQKAEIERLTTTLKIVYDGLGEAKVLLARDITKAKSEAIKEFAERLKEAYNDPRYDRPNAHTLLVKLFANIDDLVKEMVGEPIGDIRNNGEDIRHEESQDEYPHGEQSARPWKTAMLNTFLGGKRDE